MKSLFLAGIVVLSGCASAGPVIPEPAQLHAAASGTFVGNNVSRVADRFGIPHAQEEFQGRKYMLWYANTTMQWRERVTTTEAGTVGRNDWPYQSVPYASTSQSQQMVPEQYRCTMQVQVDDAGTVEAIGFVGKMGACQVFMP